MIFTYAYLDLPPLPQSLIDAAWQSVEQNKNNHEVKVNNWLSRPGYADYEYRNFELRNHSLVKTIKSHRYTINEEFDQWVRDHFDPDPRNIEYNEWGGVAVYDDHSSFFAPHVDITRDYAIMYVLDPGGKNVETSWYRERGHGLQRPDLRGVFDLDRVPRNFDSLDEIDRVCFPTGQWILLNASILHAVENVESTRIAIQISRDTVPKVGFTYVSQHQD